MILRYYADAEIREWHDHTLRLFRTLYDTHGIAVEIDRIDEQHGTIADFPGEIRSSTPEDVYERDLKRNRALNQTIDQTPSEAFKRYGKLDIAGNVAVVDDEGTVQWASTLPGYANGYRPGVASQTAMDFLEDIAIRPSNRLCVECLSLLDGDETFCPDCGREFP
ncbi:zinc ribbon domain-containing protein [Halorubrum sp. C3]|nr:zinc ribbon domain-containing protein [Halorubrum sp. C3]